MRQNFMHFKVLEVLKIWSFLSFSCKKKRQSFIKLFASSGLGSKNNCLQFAVRNRITVKIWKFVHIPFTFIQCFYATLVSPEKERFGDSITRERSSENRRLQPVGGEVLGDRVQSFLEPEPGWTLASTIQETVSPWGQVNTTLIYTNSNYY